MFGMTENNKLNEKKLSEKIGDWLWRRMKLRSINLFAYIVTLFIVCIMNIMIFVLIAELKLDLMETEKDDILFYILTYNILGIILSFFKKDKTVFVKGITVRTLQGEDIPCAIIKHKQSAVLPIILLPCIYAYIRHNRYYLVYNVESTGMAEGDKINKSLLPSGILNCEPITKSKFNALISNPQSFADEIGTVVNNLRPKFLDTMGQFFDAKLLEEIYHTNQVSLCRTYAGGYYLFHYSEKGGHQVGFVPNQGIIDEIQKDASFVMRVYAAMSFSEITVVFGQEQFGVMLRDKAKYEWRHRHITEDDKTAVPEAENAEVKDTAKGAITAVSEAENAEVKDAAKEAITAVSEAENVEVKNAAKEAPKTLLTRKMINNMLLYSDLISIAGRLGIVLVLVLCGSFYFMKEYFGGIVILTCILSVIIAGSHMLNRLSSRDSVEYIIIETVCIGVSKEVDEDDRVFEKLTFKNGMQYSSTADSEKLKHPYYLICTDGGTKVFGCYSSVDYRIDDSIPVIREW